MRPFCHVLTVLTWLLGWVGSLAQQVDVAPATSGVVPVTFPGAQAFSADDLRAAIREQLAEIDEQGLTKARADDAAFFLGNFYREHGYAQAEVLWEILSENHLALKVREGPVTLIEKINFNGNKVVSDPTLEQHLLVATRDRSKDHLTDLPLIEADLQTGVEAIREYYATEGFLNAVVSLNEIQYDRRKTRAEVTVTVHEGIQYVWGQVTFTGDVILEQAELTVCLGECEGRAYTPNQLIKAQRDLVYFYKSKGYFNAEITAAGDPMRAIGGRVPVTFTIDAGPQYQFGDVTVTGLDRLHPDFLPERFRSLKGEVYSPEKAQEKFRDMMRTGLFTNLRLQEEPLPNGEVRLDLTAEEAKSRELGFSLGFSTFEGAIGGISWRDRNLFGQGRPFTAEVKVGQRGLLGEVLYVDPWFLHDQFTGRVRLYGTTRTFDGYDKQEYGLRAEVTRKLTEKAEVTAFVQGRKIQLEALSFAPLREDVEFISGLPPGDVERAREAAIAKVVGATDYSIVSAGLTQSLDRRDSPLNPTRGWLLNSSAEVAADALGDGVAFFRGTVAASYYRPVWKGVLAAGVRAGVLNPMGDDEIPVDERFFNGGARSVRSFAERELGPTDANGLPIGGEVFTVLNVEYTLPLFRGLEGAVFIDAGSVGNEGRLGDLRHGVGLGLRYRTPVGPLRLDFGVNPSPRDGESRGAFHISIGTSF